MRESELHEHKSLSFNACLCVLSCVPGDFCTLILKIRSPKTNLRIPGSVKLKAEKKYMSLGGVWHAGDSIMESIMVRATSATDPSTKDLEPLHQDAERVAFLYAWWKAKKQLLSEKSEANTLALKSFFVKARSYRATRQHRIHTVR